MSPSDSSQWRTPRAQYDPIMSKLPPPPQSTPIGSIEVAGTTLTVLRSVFANGRVAIFLEHQGAMYARLCVNVPSVAIEADQMLVKTYDENAELRAPLLASGLFVDTGRRVPINFVELEVWCLA